MQTKTHSTKIIICVLLSMLLLLTSCTSQQTVVTSSPGKSFSSLDDFTGCAVGSLSGTVFTEFLDENLTNIEHLYYDDLDSQVEAVANGEVSAICLDQPVARLVVADHPDLTIFPQEVTYDVYGFAFQKNDPLIPKVNSIIQKFTEDGTTANIAKIWFSSDEKSKRLPQFEDDPAYDKSGGVLRFGIDTVYEPMTYINKKGDTVGYDIDLMSRIAHELNMELELVPTHSRERIEALEEGRIDVAGSCLSITEERKKLVDFSIPYYIGGAVLVVRAENNIADPVSTVDSIPAD